MSHQTESISKEIEIIKKEPNGNSGYKVQSLWDAWVAQSVKHPTSAQVTISQFVSSSPTLGSVPTAQSLEPASYSVSPTLSVPPPLALSLSQKKNKH